MRIVHFLHWEIFKSELIFWALYQLFWIFWWKSGGKSILEADLLSFGPTEIDISLFP
jgi:hypothetical protein